MRVNLTAMILAVPVVIGLTPGNAGANDVVGTWQSEKNGDGAYIHVDIGPCASDGGKVCGKIVDAVDPTTTEKPEWVGRNIIEDMVAQSSTAWADGTIWAPDDDTTYSAEMELKGDVLTVSGCVLGGLICRGQDWTRVK